MHKIRERDPVGVFAAASWPRKEASFRHVDIACHLPFQLSVPFSDFADLLPSGSRRLNREHRQPPHTAL